MLMKQIIRAQYRAALKKCVTEEKLEKAVNVCCAEMEKEKQEGRILTGGMFRYHNLLFLYMEYIIDVSENTAEMRKGQTDKKEKQEELADCADRIMQERIIQYPERLFPGMAPLLHTWQELAGELHWAYMYPVFWFDMPESLESWMRKEEPAERCGRIAVLYPDKLFSYVCHHQAIVEEGLLVGDRYQMISLHENLLFSYFETPRDREQVNIRRSEEESQEIHKWEAADPAGHFQRFAEEPEENFHVIETLISVG